MLDPRSQAAAGPPAHAGSCNILLSLYIISCSGDMVACPLNTVYFILIHQHTDSSRNPNHPTTPKNDSHNRTRQISTRKFIVCFETTRPQTFCVPSLPSLPSRRLTLCSSPPDPRPWHASRTLHAPPANSIGDFFWQFSAILPNSAPASRTSKRTASRLPRSAKMCSGVSRFASVTCSKHTYTQCHTRTQPHTHKIHTNTNTRTHSRARENARTHTQEELGKEGHC